MCLAAHVGVPVRNARRGLSVVLAEETTPRVALRNTGATRAEGDLLVDSSVGRSGQHASYSKTRSTTAVRSLAPARKYRPAVSTEACPSRACTCATSAPPW